MMIRLACSIMALSMFVGGVAANLEWDLHHFEKPYQGEHTGVKIYDLNHDGYPDILFSAVS